jgi:sporulation protein YlmC with PRC-barrel domain
MRENISLAFQDLYRHNRAYKLTDDGKLIGVIKDFDLEIKIENLSKVVMEYIDNIADKLEAMTKEVI